MIAHKTTFADARTALVIAFPPSRGYRGASTTIKDLSRHGLFSGHLGLTPEKSDAVRLIVAASMEGAAAYGKGSKAANRMNHHGLQG